ncbi:hypothetical protein [Succinimonas sp.]
MIKESCGNRKSTSQTDSVGKTTCREKYKNRKGAELAGHTG